MELTELLNAGGIAGVIGNAINSLVAIAFAGVFTRLRSVANQSAIKLTVEQHLLALLAHLAVGLGLGFIFWLSWGFTALVGVTWWQRGLIFGLALWALCVVPLISAQRWNLRERSATIAIVAAQWLTTFGLAGLACAWRWAHQSQS